MAPTEVQVTYEDGSTGYIPIDDAVKVGYQPQVEVNYDDGSTGLIPLSEAKSIGYKQELEPAGYLDSMGDALTTFTNSYFLNGLDNVADWTGGDGEGIRARTDRFKRDYPWLSTGVEMSSAFAPGPGMVGKVVKGASKAPALVRNLARLFSGGGTAANATRLATEAGVRGMADHNMTNEDVLTSTALASAIPALSGVIGRSVSSRIAGDAIGGVPQDQAAIRRAFDQGLYTSDDLTSASGLLQLAKRTDKPLTLIEALQTKISPTETMQKDMLFDAMREYQQLDPRVRKVVDSFRADRQVKDAERITKDLDLVFPTNAGDDLIKAYDEASTAPTQIASEFYNEAERLSPVVSGSSKASLDRLVEDEPLVKQELNKMVKLVGAKAKDDQIYSSKVLQLTRNNLRDKSSNYYEKGQKTLGYLYKEKADRLTELLPQEFKEADKIFEGVAKYSTVRAGLQDVVNKTNDRYELVNKLIGTPKKRQTLKSVMSDSAFDEFLQRSDIESRMQQGYKFFDAGSNTASRLANQTTAGAPSNLFSTIRSLPGRAIGKVGEGVKSLFANPDDPLLNTQFLMSTGDDAIMNLEKMNRYLEANSQQQQYSEATKNIARALLRGGY